MKKLENTQADAKIAKNSVLAKNLVKINSFWFLRVIKKVNVLIVQWENLSKAAKSLLKSGTHFYLTDPWLK